MLQIKIRHNVSLPLCFPVCLLPTSLWLCPCLCKSQWPATASCWDYSPAAWGLRVFGWVYAERPQCVLQQSPEHHWKAVYVRPEKGQESVRLPCLWLHPYISFKFPHGLIYQFFPYPFTRGYALKVLYVKSYKYSYLFLCAFMYLFFTFKS